MFLHIYIRNEVINYIFGSAQLNGSEMKFGKEKMKSLTCYGHPRVEGVVGGLMLDWLRGGCGCSRQRTLVAPGESSARA